MVSYLRICEKVAKVQGKTLKDLQKFMGYMLSFLSCAVNSAVCHFMSLCQVHDGKC